MAAPTITSTSPANNSTNVGRNKILTVTFDQALDTSTVIPAHFLLTHTASGMKMNVAVSYDAATFTVSVTPSTLLFPNASFRLRVVGADISAPTGAVQNVSDEDLAVTLDVVFTTSDDIDVPAGGKSEEDEANEGQLDLPAGIIVGPTATFQLVSSKPSSNSWGFTGDNITLTFNRNVEPNSVTGNVIINQLPFLDEDGWIARKSTGGNTSGNYIFEWEDVTGGTYGAGFFQPPNWSYIISGKTVRLNIPENSGNNFANIRYEVTVTEELTDTTGNNLIDEEFITFTSPAYPSYITPRTIRNEVNAVFDSINLDFVQELVWKYSIDAFRMTGLDKEQFTQVKGNMFRKFVKCSTSLAIMRDLFMHKSVMAGVSKTLGDLTITYHPNAGSTKDNPIIKQLEKCVETARRAIDYKAHTARVFIRGVDSPLEKPNFRTRLWKNPRVHNASGQYRSHHYPVGNTQLDKRDGIVPGNYDDWS